MGLAISGALWGILFLGFAISSSFKGMGAAEFSFIVFLLVSGVAYVAWAEWRAKKRAVAIQALKPMNVVFFDEGKP
jgi:hypothetical protein